MSNKRSSKNTNKILTSLRQKKSKGGRTKKYFGGVEGNIDIITEEEIKRNIESQKKNKPQLQETAEQKAAREAAEKAAKEKEDKLAAEQAAEAARLEAERVAKYGKVSVTNSGTSTTTTTPTSTNTTTSNVDPEPKRSDYKGNVGGQNAYKNAHNAWKARQGENARNLNITENNGSGLPEDIYSSIGQTGQQGNNMANNKTNVEDFVKSIPRPQITSPEKPTVNSATVKKLAVSDVKETDPDTTKLKAGLSTKTEKLDDATAISREKAIAGTATTTLAPGTAQAESVTTFEPAEYTAAKAVDLDPTISAIGDLSAESIADHDEIRELTEKAEGVTTTADQKSSTLAKEAQFTIDSRTFARDVTGSETQVSSTKAAEEKQRTEILGEPAPAGDAAAITDVVGFQAAQRRTVTGTAAKGAAAEMIAQTSGIPSDITAAIVEDPATVEAQIDEQPVEVRAAVAALPTEALVSSQMDSLLGGLEDGETPAWAKPAISAVEQKLAQRGLSASTVGRDALFNAIIQSALPMAQSNAQALQQRAAQNLSNEQQANLTQYTQDMQRRMANLANKQTAASQTAQMAQQMGVLQSNFDQQAVLTSAQQQQQTRTQNLANEQQSAVLRSQNQQAINAMELGNEQQIELAEMKYEDATARENMTAYNQKRLVDMQIAADFLVKNAGFKQQMELANLSNDQQMRLANLSSRNQNASENLSAAQQTELADLNSRLQTNLLQGKIAAEMNQAQLNVDQQQAIQHASTVANIDLTKFNAAQQVELANSKAMQTLVLADLSNEQQAMLQNATALASLDMAAVDQRTKVAITNAQSFLSMDMANLNNEQQAIMFDQQAKQQRILSDQAAINAEKQFNATSKNQVNQFLTSTEAAMRQFNASQQNAMTQFNTSEINRLKAINAQNVTDVSKHNASLKLTADQFNENMDLQRDTWNAANAQAVEQSNIEWRRKSNTIDTAAQNASNMLNAQQVFQMDSAEMAFLWQNLRDDATYVRTAFENEQQRKTTLYATALANEGATGGAEKSTNVDRLFTLINGIT